MDKMTPTINEFANYYEFRGDYDHTPTDGERTMIEDAITGYLEDTGLAQALTTLQGERDRLRDVAKMAETVIDELSRDSKDDLGSAMRVVARQIRAALHPEPLGEGGGL
jgi:hypothetical protein